MDARSEVKKHCFCLFTNSVLCTCAEVCDDVPDMDTLLMEILEQRLVGENVN